MGIKKSAEVLVESAKELDRTYVDVTTRITKMRGQLDSLQTQWVGRGGVAFQGTINRWQTSADKVKESLEEFGQQLRDVEASYGSTEDVVEKAFNKYEGGLG
ncbi:MAG: WXG100 family type VII secretion target [Nocardioides sp.]|nr:WXG100 family type VII secretion target [Nocardioides sp.]